MYDRLIHRIQFQTPLPNIHYKFIRQIHNSKYFKYEINIKWIYLSIYVYILFDAAVYFGNNIKNKITLFIFPSIYNVRKSYLRKRTNSKIIRDEMDISFNLFWKLLFATEREPNADALSGEVNDRVPAHCICNYRFVKVTSFLYVVVGCTSCYMLWIYIKNNPFLSW